MDNNKEIVSFASRDVALSPYGDYCELFPLRSKRKRANMFVHASDSGILAISGSIAKRSLVIARLFKRQDVCVRVCPPVNRARSFVVFYSGLVFGLCLFIQISNGSRCIA